MRLSELLGCPVYDTDGRPVGTVIDVRLAHGNPDPHRPPFQLNIDSLLVSSRRTGSLFGYDRRDQQGPWLVRVLIRRLHRGAFRLPWDQVADWDREHRKIQLTAG
jgi:hypothetical protein